MNKFLMAFLSVLVVSSVVANYLPPSSQDYTLGVMQNSFLHDGPKSKSEVEYVDGLSKSRYGDSDFQYNEDSDNEKEVTQAQIKQQVQASKKSLFGRFSSWVSKVAQVANKVVAAVSAFGRKMFII